MAARLCLVLGGVRSGKSSFAEKLAGNQSRNQAAETAGRVLYLATGLPTDAEMEERIRRHRESRPPHWTTLEEPLELADRLGQAMDCAGPPDVVLIDSLDTWLSNMLLEYGDQDTQDMESSALCQLDRMLDVMAGTTSSFFFVSSEVGLSLVPTESLGRRFQDLLGLINQRVAAAADQVFLVVAGIPIQIKGSGVA